ncbi:ABC transporter ATP-binding protein [Bdellovibrio svalbardensis]|uniref:ABC transporter ATP-binding protein n=1 Tax=Bdellovibrio svalbardensis TaxID=2972972 RepID=A0ABT6DL19_9BACT|nr:ABC transporter ATP-binding protein [Bdellovibrio svalbardensis]MDG0816589.1 ABC transporter ATP-binding protein [Bdellovibrio svalbardensis]
MPETTAAAASIQIKDLTKDFAKSTAGPVILDMNVQIAAGSFVSLVGASGSGKSTLLRLIAGLEKPTSGSVQTNTEQIGFVFQDANLLPWKTALENVYLPFELLPDLGLKKEEMKNKALKALEKVKLQEAAHLFPHELSGGMKMRVAIARALVTQPRLLLLDEPFAALDEITRSELQLQLRDLWKSEKMTVIFVTHSLVEASFLAERVIMLKGTGAKISSDKVLDLPGDRTDSLRTSETFNKVVRELSERLRA